MTGAPAPRILFGILCMCSAGLLFNVMGGFGKILGRDYSSLQVSWARTFIHLIFMLAMFMPAYGVRLLRTRRLPTQLARSTMLFLSNLCFFYAITVIPLAMASTISLAGPLIVALLAWPMLKERTTIGRVAALAAGFLGVLVVIRPGTVLFQPASLFIVASACFYAMYQLLTRRIAATEAPETLATYSAVVGAIGMIFVLPFVWITPGSLADIGMFIGVGVLGGAGHYLVARALISAPANIVTPFQYFQLIGAVAVGYWFFGDLPDAYTGIGAAIIIASGLYIGWSQTRRA